MKICGQPNCFEPDACIWPKCNTKQKDKTMKPTTITAYPVMLPTEEKMYSREEVIAFAKKYAERCQAPVQVGERWINENL